MNTPTPERTSSAGHTASDAAGRWRDELDRLSGIFADLGSEWRGASGLPGCPLQQAAACLDRAEAVMDDPDHATALALRALSLAPEFGRAHYTVGLLRSRRGEVEGLDHLLRSVEIDPRRAHQAFAAIGAFLRKSQGLQRAAEIRETVAALSDRAGMWTAERESGPGLMERFLPPDFAPSAETAIRTALSVNQDVAEATIVRRATSEWRHLPAFLVAMRLRPGWRGASVTHEDGASGRLAGIADVIGVYGSVQTIWPGETRDNLLCWRMWRARGAFHYRRPADFVEG